MGSEPSDLVKFEHELKEVDLDLGAMDTVALVTSDQETDMNQSLRMQEMLEV